MNDGGLSPSPFLHASSSSSALLLSLTCAKPDGPGMPLARLARDPVLPFRRAFLFHTQRPDAQLALFALSAADRRGASGVAVEIFAS